MSSFLLGVPGQLKAIRDNVATLIGNFTSTIAGRIDAAISTRAPASTALDSTVWTNTRAGRLDSVPSIAAAVAEIALSPGLDNPTEVQTPTRVADLNAAFSKMSGFEANAPSITTGYATAKTITGRGVVNFLGFGCTTAPTGTLGIRVTVDGTVIINTTATFTGAHDEYGIVLIGAAAVSGSGGSAIPAGVAFGEVPFFSEFKIEHYGSDGTGAMRSLIAYRKTT